MKKYLKKPAIFLGMVSLALSACDTPADVAANNLSEAADRFQILRNVSFYNSLHDVYIAEFEGFCSILDEGHQVEVTCLVGKDEQGVGVYFKHLQGLSDNVTYTAVQLEGKNVDPYHNRITFRPETIVPEIKLDVSE